MGMYALQKVNEGIRQMRSTHFYPINIAKDSGPTVTLIPSQDFEVMQAGVDGYGTPWGPVEARSRSLGWIMDALKERGVSPAPDYRVEITNDPVGLNAADVANAIVYALKERAASC